MRTAIYDPLSAFRRLQNEMNRAFSSAALPSVDEQSAPSRAWIPAVDIREEEDRFVIRADVPGIEPEAIEVTTENGVLAITGERRPDDAQDNGTGGQRVERVHGSFYRRFTMPDSVDVDHIEARSAHGVLEISVPKKAREQVKKIKINA